MHKSGLIELEAIIAVARRGSFRAAAVELGMSPTALSHAVAGLETRLGVRLFNRTTRSVSLSAAGEQFVATVAPALSDIHGAMEAANSHRDTPAGILRINSSVGAARQILTPIVLEYLKRYPDMRLDLVTEARMIDIVADSFDAGIRTMDTVPKDMIAVPFGPPLRYAVVGSPAYFEAHPKPGKPQDLMQHCCIRARLPSGALYRWEFEKQGEVLTLDVPGSLTLDEPTLILEAAREGAGLAYLSEWSTAADIAAGRLVRILEDWTPALPGLCLYYPSRRLLPAGLRALVDLIHEVGRR
ncbi:LysR family transcriptional regulator (plasmid) [Rhizobium sp. CB3171]|uniref:LysR family transcriptional regulator n=1 Tax=Rhizobium sp. CB3171 TaxID=3039157 RepID=UPI0024B163E9|nr:LysR family transcriptional regulator [Rhizobium sp. CB3171]WFU06246.1 LysR family transcriptional regulator [Rhizobium sp. CB3171]